MNIYKVTYFLDSEEGESFLVNGDFPGKSTKYYYGKS